MLLGMKRAGLTLAAAFMLVSVVRAQAPAAPAAAPEPPADPKTLVGDWTTALEGLPGGPQLGTLKVTLEGDTLKGTTTTPLGEQALDEIKVVGSKFVTTFFMDAMGNQMDVQITIKTDGDKFAGDMQVGGGMLSATLRGAKPGTAAETALKEEVEKKRLEIIGVPVLPVADAKDFMGEWTFKGESPMGGEMEVDFALVDVEGKASGKLALPPPLGTHTINKLSKSDTGLQALYSMELMGNPMDMTIDLSRSGNIVEGLIDVGGGLFQIPLEGVKKGRGLAKMTAGGKTILIEHGRPSTSGAGYKGMSSVKEGFIWRLGNNERTSMKTTGELKVGDKSVAAGSYSLWGKKTAAGWNLIINGEAEGWGMKHDPSKDVAEIPMTMGKPAAAGPELLTISLRQDGAPGNGLVTLAWGDIEGKGNFQVVMPPPPAPAGAAPAAK